MKLNKLFLGTLFISVIALILSFVYFYVYLPNLSIKEVGGCVPTNFKKESINNEYHLTWSTKDECSGYVKYGVSDNSFPYVALDVQGVIKLKEHNVVLNGIDKGNRYFFVIISEEKNYGNEALPISITFE